MWERTGTRHQMSHGFGSNSSTTREIHEAFSLCLGRSMMDLEAAGISLHSPAQAAIPRSPPHPTHHWHFGLFSLSQKAALAKRLHSGHSTAPSPSSDTICVTVSALCPTSNLSGALRNTQVLNGAPALVEETVLGEVLNVAWHWSVLRAPALPCEHCQCRSECVQHDSHPGISPSLCTQQETFSLHSSKHTGLAPSAVRNGALAWCCWYFPNKLILLLVHPSFIERESLHPAQLWAGRPTSGLFSTWLLARCPENLPPEVQPPSPWLLPWEHHKQQQGFSVPTYLQLTFFCVSVLISHAFAT